MTGASDRGLSHQRLVSELATHSYMSNEPDRKNAPMSPRVLGLLCLALVSWSALTPRAHAQEAQVEQPSSARDTEARGLFEAGRAAFTDGRFQDALDYFRRAHEMSQRPELLYNIGMAEDRLRNDQAALDAFEAFLAAFPETPNHAEVQGRIDALRASIAARATPIPATPDPAPGVATVVSSGPSILWTWIVGGVALAAGGAAIGTWVAANDQYGTLERGCYALRGTCTDSEIAGSGVESLVTATNVLFVSALVLAAGAGVALAFELTSGGETTTHAQLGLSPGALFVRGTF